MNYLKNITWILLILFCTHKVMASTCEPLFISELQKAKGKFFWEELGFPTENLKRNEALKTSRENKELTALYESPVITDMLYEYLMHKATSVNKFMRNDPSFIKKLQSGDSFHFRKNSNLIKEIIDSLNTAMKVTNTLSKETVLFRGELYNKEAIFPQRDSTTSDNAFLSTSIDPKIALKFANSENGEGSKFASTDKDAKRVFRIFIVKSDNMKAIYAPYALTKYRKHNKSDYYYDWQYRSIVTEGTMILPSNTKTTIIQDTTIMQKNGFPLRVTIEEI